MEIELRADESPKASALAREIEAARECGVARCAFGRVVGAAVPVADLAAVREAAAKLLESVGYKPLGTGPPLLRGEARAVIAAALATDLAYGDASMSAEDAERFADRFLALFAADAVFLSNGSLGRMHAAGGGSGSWVAVSAATFDTGVVAVDSARVGLVWVEDED